MNKAEKSLRWVVNQIPDFKPTTNEEKMLVAIKLYSEAGAEEINRLEAENAALREQISKMIIPPKSALRSGKEINKMLFSEKVKLEKQYLSWCEEQNKKIKGGKLNTKSFINVIAFLESIGFDDVNELKKENDKLKERLKNAVEIPCIEPMTTWDWDENTGCGKAHFGKFWQVLYRDNDGEFIAYIGATKEEATAMLSELKGEKNG